MDFNAEQEAHDLIEKIKDVSGDFKNAADELKRSRGFWSIWRNGKRVAVPLVREIEQLSREIVGGLSGPQKRDIAVEGIMQLIPEPPWMTFFLRFLLGRGIDAAVAKWNDYYGKDKKWPDLS